MNGDGQTDTVFIHHFNRGTSAQYLFNSHKNEAHYDGHPGRDWEITNTGLYRTAAYILDMEIVNYTGNKEDLEVEVVDIWGNGIKGIVDVPALQIPAVSKLSKKESNLNFTVIPNPSNNQQITVHLQNEKEQTFTVTLIDVFGKIHYNKKVTGKNYLEISFNKVLRGVFWLNLENGDQRVSRQIILE